MMPWNVAVAMSTITAICTLMRRGNHFHRRHDGTLSSCLRTAGAPRRASTRAANW